MSSHFDPPGDVRNGRPDKFDHPEDVPNSLPGKYDHPGDVPNSLPDKGYALSGKIMLSAIVILFFVVILMVCLHLYARWYLLRARRRHIRRNRNRRTNLVFYVDPANPTAIDHTVPTRGLDESVLKSLPVFLFSSKTHPETLECAVCLSEFEENEKGRNLPKCNHSFHIGCIDMWFHSHSTCPLCRAPVEPLPTNQVEIIISPSGGDPAGTESPSSSGLCATCQDDEEQVGSSTSSLGGRRKPMALMSVSIEVPRRTGTFEDESGTESPASQAYRSPMSRMLSLKRILSRERRGSPSPSPGNVANCSGSATELDIERSREENQ